MSETDSFYLGLKNKIRINTNSYNKAYYMLINACKYYVKEITLRDNETTENAKKRIEKTEELSNMYAKKGINTVAAINFNGSYVHEIDGSLFVVYPWVDNNIANVPCEKICDMAGEVLAYMHNYRHEITLSGMSYSIGTLEYSDFADIKRIELNADIMKMYEDFLYANECLERLKNSAECVISHRDIHPGNLVFNKNKLYVIDWECSGIINVDEELFDVAVSFCGFCKGKTDLELFERIVSSYYKNIVERERKYHIDDAIGALYSSIIFDLIKILQKSSLHTKDLCKCHNYMLQYKEMKKYEKCFKRIMTQYTN